MSIIATELTSLLTADTVNGYPATPTQVNGVNISAVIECQSTTRGFVLPRMTTAQKNAIPTPTNGMQVFDTDIPGADIYQNGAWQGGFGNGNVVGPANSPNNGVAVFNGVTGKLIQAAAVAINPISAVVTGIASLFSSTGTAGAPTYSFTGDTNTGVYSDQADSIGVATGGALQLRVASALASVNNLLISGALASNSPNISAEGSDTNIGITVTPKGTGNFYCPRGFALTGATGSTSGMFLGGGSAIVLSTQSSRAVQIQSGSSTGNAITLSGAISGSNVAIGVVANGSDTNVGISISGIGTGRIYGPGGSAALPGWAFNGTSTSQTTGMYFNANTFLGFSFNGTHKVAVAPSGVSIGTTSLDATATNVLTIASGNTPTGIASSLQIYAPTLGGNAGCLGLTMNSGAVTPSTTNTNTSKIRIEINGTSYYLLASDNAT